MHSLNVSRSLAGGAAALALALGYATGTQAASHREAPLMTLDPGADITDVYAFVSYDKDNLKRPLADRKVTLILNAVPGQEPGSGPNYFAFDDNVLYEINVDNDRDGVADDVVYQFRFRTETTNGAQFIYPVANPPVTDIDGEGAKGLARIQRFTVTELRDCPRTHSLPEECKHHRVLFDGKALPTVPSNIGPRTTPDYDNLAALGVLTDPATEIRVFAGQRAETFAIDLGAVFDTINLRVENATPIPNVRPPLPVQTAAEDANDKVNPFGNNTFSGFNVNTIAIEVPAKRLTQDGKKATIIGVFASTSRQKATLRRGEPGFNFNHPSGLLRGKGRFVQVSRMANPLVNELIIPVGNKDLWNATLPEDEDRLLKFYRDLAVADALQLVSNIKVPPKPRNDVVQLLLQYPGSKPGRFSELLRLNLTVPPTPPGQIKRLGPFAHDDKGNPTPDPAGFPNGRRPNDDVTDLVVRVAGGPPFFQNFVGDGVGINEKGITPDFPFLPTPYDGRNRRHIDPGE